MRKKIFSTVALVGGGIAVVAMVLVVNYFTMAWIEPTMNPPGGVISGLSKHSLDAADGDPADAVYVDDDGKVGIGTTEPNRKLTVTHDDIVANFRYYTASVNSVKSVIHIAALTSGVIADGLGPQLNFHTGNQGLDGYLAGKIYTKRSGADTDHDLYIEPSGSSGIMIASNGDVGIGLTSGIDESLVVNGNVKATAFLYDSDKNLKKNIQIIPNALEKVLQLEGVLFAWKDEEKDLGINLGLIAQDVEKVFPELVSTSETTGLKSLQYGNLVAPLVEAIKEQQEQIEELKQEIEKLKIKTE